MNLKKKSPILALLLLAVITVSSVSALVYVLLTFNMSATIQTIGNIEAYEDDNTTPLTAFDYGAFNATAETRVIYFWVRNVGNVPVVLHITTPTAGWTWTTPPATGAYHDSSVFSWSPYSVPSGIVGDTLNSANKIAPTVTIDLAVSEEKLFAVAVTCSDILDPSEVFNVDLDISAEDA